jgi:hypothetical protein
MSSISRADRCARASHASRHVHRSNALGLRVNQNVIEPHLARAARFAMQSGQPAFRSSLWALKERLDAHLQCGKSLPHAELALHRELATYFAS